MMAASSYHLMMASSTPFNPITLFSYYKLAELDSFWLVTVDILSLWDGQSSWTLFGDEFYNLSNCLKVYEIFYKPYEILDIPHDIIDKP